MFSRFAASQPSPYVGGYRMGNPASELRIDGRVKGKFGRMPLRWSLGSLRLAAYYQHGAPPALGSTELAPPKSAPRYLGGY